MAQTKIGYDNKDNPVPIVNRKQQATAEDFNDIKSVINDNVDDVEERFENLAENQITGVEVYTTFADEGGGDSFLPVTGFLLVSYKVSNDPDTNKNGYYHWSGSVYIKDADLVRNIVESTNNSEAVSGAAVFEHSSKVVNNEESIELLKLDLKEYTGIRESIVEYSGVVFDTFAGNSKVSYIMDGDVVSDSVVDSIGIHISHVAPTRVKIFVNTFLKVDIEITSVIGENIIDFNGFLNLKAGDVIQVAYESVDATIFNLPFISNPTPDSDWFRINKYTFGKDVINANRSITTDLQTLFIPVNLYLREREIASNSIDQQSVEAFGSLVSGDSEEVVMSFVHPSYEEIPPNVGKSRFTYAIMQDAKEFNRVGIYARAITTDTLDAGIIAKVFVNGKLKATVNIPESDIEDLSIIGDDSLLIIDLGRYLRVENGDELCVGWSSLGSFDLGLLFVSNNTPSDANELTRNYNLQFSTDEVSNALEAPVRPLSQNFFYIPFHLYKTELFNQSIPTNEILYPHRLYHTVNDDDATGFTGNFSLPLYIDHFIKKRSILFSNQKDFIQIPNNIVKTGDGIAEFNSGVDVDTQPMELFLNDGRRIRYTMKSTLASAQQREAFVLTIGDSITFGIGTTNNITGSEDKGNRFWVKAAQLLEDNANLNKNIMVGSNRSNLLDSGDFAAAEGRSGWSLFNYMRHSTNLKEASGYLALGFLDTYTGSEAQKALIATTNEVDPGGLPENPFYDGALVGFNRFSIAKWLDRYRTMDDNGVRLTLADPTLGTEITNQADLDKKNVLTPTHVVLALGTNDVFFGTNDTYFSNLIEIITTLKSQIPGVIIGVQPVPDTAGTFYPERYEIDGVTRTEGGGDHDNRSLVYKRVAHDILNSYDEEADKVYIIPTFFVAPTANAYTLREIPNTDGTILKSKFGDETHVSHYAHDNWGYLLYSWIKYTTTI